MHSIDSKAYSSLGKCEIVHTKFRVGQRRHLERPETSCNGDEGSSRDPDQACCEVIRTCVMRQLSIPLRAREPGGCAGCKHSSETCTRAPLKDVDSMVSRVARGRS